MTKPLTIKGKIRPAQLIENQCADELRAAVTPIARDVLAMLAEARRAGLTPPGGVPRDACMPLPVRPSDLLAKSRVEK